MLDISVDCRLAQAGVPVSRDRLDDLVGYLNTLFRRTLGKQFVDGMRSDDVYVARFTNEDAARVAMGWCDCDLAHVRIMPFGRGATLTGFFASVP